MSFAPPPPGAGREAYERALAAPTELLREAAAEPISGLAGVDLEAALAGAEHEFIRYRDPSVHLELHPVGPDCPTVVFHHGLGDSELPGQGHQVFLDHLDRSAPRLLEWIDSALP